MIRLISAVYTWQVISLVLSFLGFLLLQLSSVVQGYVLRQNWQGENKEKFIFGEYRCLASRSALGLKKLIEGEILHVLGGEGKF